MGNFKIILLIVFLFKYKYAFTSLNPSEKGKKTRFQLKGLVSPDL